MKLKDLLAQFREDTDDYGDLNGKGQLFKNASVVRWLNEAEDEACIRKQLIFDRETPALCEVDVTEGIGTYALDPRMFEVTRAALYRFNAPRYCQRLVLTSRTTMDRDYPGWRVNRADPEFLIQEDTRIVIPAQVNRDYTLRIEGYRLPLVPMSVDDVEGSPEIGAPHHRFLVHWALHRAYSKPDSEVYDPKRSQTALNAFEQYFGLRPDADLRKDTNADQPHHNKAYF